MEAEQRLLLEPEDVKPSFKGWEVKGILNPAGVRLASKKIMLVARVAENSHQNDDPYMRCPVVISSKQYRTMGEKIHPDDVVAKDQNLIYLKDKTCRLKTFSHFRKVLLDETGFKVEKVFKEPSFHGTNKEGQYGVEDPRITEIVGSYYMTYVTVNKVEGVCTNLAVSKNLRNWERKGIIFREQNKDVALFPEKINGEYVALHRPEGSFEFSRPSIWISHSKDLVYWGKEKSIVGTREGYWESERVGGGSVPLKTKEGWLEIYHGVYEKRRQKVYSAGAVLLDLEEPERVLARTPKSKPLFKPERRYEKKGYINDVVFPTVTIPDLDGESLLVYSGGGDTVISVRKVFLQDILDSLKSAKS